MATSTLENKNLWGWGIAGCGRRCEDFADAIDRLRKDGHELRGVASSRGKKFVLKFSDTEWNPIIHESFQALAEDKTIDVVYVGTSAVNHFSVAALMMNHDKHVIIESPICIHSEEMEELIAIAEKKKVVMMQGISALYFPLMIKFDEILEHYDIGVVEGINIVMGCRAYPFEYGVPELEQGRGPGFMFGPFCLHIVLKIFNEAPSNIKITGNVDQDGVADMISGILFFGERPVNFTLFTKREATNEIEIMGSDGCCHLSNLLLGHVRINVTNVRDGENYFEGEPENMNIFLHEGSSALVNEIKEAVSLIEQCRNELGLPDHTKTLMAVKLLEYIHQNIEHLIVPERVLEVPTLVVDQ